MADPYVAQTDRAWFQFLSERADWRRVPDRGFVDEANFWMPRAQRPFANLVPGQPVFLRLKAPEHKIAGVGYYAAFHSLALSEAWSLFEWRNGCDSYASFRHRLVRLGHEPAEEAQSERRVGCVVLANVELWEQRRWIPWGDLEEFSPNTQQGKFVRDARQAAMLLAATEPSLGVAAPEFAERFSLVTADGRRWRDAAAQAARDGQGAFRLRLLDAYGRQCAITGEHTEPVLDAAHIQPYLGRASNHVQNGLVLCKEFHTLFDRGYVTVTPELRVRVSPLLRAEYSNGRRYYPYDDQPLATLPKDARLQPSREALDWHGRHVFRAG
ncbi:MAG: HNH endonuclease [Phycisphaerales bacterium]